MSDFALSSLSPTLHRAVQAISEPVSRAMYGLPLAKVCACVHIWGMCPMNIMSPFSAECCCGGRNSLIGVVNSVIRTIAFLDEGPGGNQ